MVMLHCYRASLRVEGVGLKMVMRKKLGRWFCQRHRYNFRSFLGSSWTLQARQ